MAQMEQMAPLAVSATPDTLDGMAYARLYGEPLFNIPTDLYIPPNALEVFYSNFFHYSRALDFFRFAHCFS